MSIEIGFLAKIMALLIPKRKKKRLRVEEKKR